MKTVKTARGKTLNMSALVQKHENERAVSNVPVNAKGDIIDSRGNVKVSREEVSKEYYKDTVVGSTETVSIKTDIEDEKIATAEPVVEEPVEKPKPKPAAKPKPAPEPVKTEPEEVIELSRRQRTREDGSKYIEVEFSDGSMEIEEVTDED